MMMIGITLEVEGARQR